MKRHSFTLIEVMIALALMGVIASTLFSYWRDLNLKNQKIESVKELFLKRELLQLRLSEVFSSLTAELSVEEEILNFEYDNGVDPDPLFCKEVKGRLFLEKGVLFLESRNDEAVRKEALMKDVKEFRYELYEVEKSPIHVRLIIDEIIFPFFLPTSHKEISL